MNNLNNPSSVNSVNSVNSVVCSNDSNHVNLYNSISSDDLFSQFTPSNYQIDEEQLENMREMGKKFYGNIDMDKYAPKDATEENLQEFLSSVSTEEQLQNLKYRQITAALKSGLLIEELTEDEKNILKLFSSDE